MLVDDELPISGIFNESIRSSITRVIVVSFIAAYSRSLFNLRSLIRILNHFAFIFVPTNYLHFAILSDNKEVIKNVESS
ncbi:hypothetical protein NIES2100_00620 [Calothrix sp. NIES-2100]|nr:hypothetical protein NIES2100_00620 [Calothrix sp. NIES-2100]